MNISNVTRSTPKKGKIAERTANIVKWQKTSMDIFYKWFVKNVSQKNHIQKNCESVCVSVLAIGVGACIYSSFFPQLDELKKKV